jgi:succinate dehydrogenase flavin-adding protein (antitoxin of CptAB toxin-antitoxin module)
MDKVNLEIPKENVDEVIHLIRCALTDERTSNEVWTLLMRFCEKYGEKLSPEELRVYKWKKYM